MFAQNPIVPHIPNYATIQQLFQLKTIFFHLHDIKQCPTMIFHRQKFDWYVNYFRIQFQSFNYSNICTHTFLINLYDVRNTSIIWINTYPLSRITYQISCRFSHRKTARGDRISINFKSTVIFQVQSAWKTTYIHTPISTRPLHSGGGHVRLQRHSLVNKWVVCCS